MTKTPAFFILDNLFALLVLLMGISAIQALYKSCYRAQLDHHLNQTAWQILANAPIVENLGDTGTSKRFYNFEGHPTQQPNCFTLTIKHNTHQHKQRVSHNLSYMDSTGNPKHQKRTYHFWIAAP